MTAPYTMLPTDPRAALRPPTIWDRIGVGLGHLFGLPDQQQGLLSAADRSTATRQGLLNAGASLLQSSGPSVTPVGIGPAIGNAVLAGRQGAYGALDATDVLAQRQRERAMLTQRDALQRKYAGKTDLPSMLSLFSEQVTMGDVQAAMRTSEVIKALAYSKDQAQATAEAAQAAAAYLQQFPGQIDPKLPAAEQVRQGRLLETRAIDQASTPQAAAYYRQQYKIPADVPDAEAVRIGRLKAQNEAYTERPPTAGQINTQERAKISEVDRQVTDARAQMKATQDAAIIGQADSTAVQAAQQRLDSLRTVRDSLVANLVHGPRGATKTPAQWVAEVHAEHPAWTARQIAAEARKRAGVK
jgi:hypothetical protein